MDNMESVLLKAESRVAEGKGLDRTGFWPAVNRAKQDRELAQRYGARIAAIDDKAFRNWAVLVVPMIPGTVLAVVATLVGLGLIAWAYWLVGLVAVAAFYVGFGIVMVTTHGLAHLTVGRLLGMRFSGWFVGTWRQPQPGVKVDYTTYLLVPAESRAWMHASGAIVTKLVPFAMIGAAVAADLPGWAIAGLAVIGVVAVITDILWSTKNSDWKKFRREMSLAN